MLEPTLFVYNLPESWIAAVGPLCGGLGIRVCPVEPGEQGLSLGALLGMLPRGTFVGQVPGEMLVMAHFPEGMLSDFLAGLRALGLKPVAAKAVLTLNNLPWTGPQLYRELLREHEAMLRKAGDRR